MDFYSHMLIYCESVQLWLYIEFNKKIFSDSYFYEFSY